MNKIDLIQNTPEWQEFRKNHLNASEAGAVMCVNPWEPKTPLQLWEVKNGLREIKQTRIMKDGLDYEPKARAKVVEKLGLVFTPCVVENGKYAASLDGVDDDDKVILELKTPNKGSQSDLWQAICSGNNPPLHYMYQMSHQFYSAMSADKVLFVVYDKHNDEICWKWIDPGFLVELWEMGLEEAWEKYAEGKPDPMPSDVISIDSEKWNNLESELKMVKEQLQPLLDYEKELKASLSDMAKERGCGVNGKLFGCYRSSRQGSINAGKLEKAGIDVNEYRNKSTDIWSVREL